MQYLTKSSNVEVNIFKYIGQLYIYIYYIYSYINSYIYITKHRVGYHN